MPIRISYTNSTNKASGNIVFFVDEKYNTKNFKKFTSTIELSYINDLLKSSDLKKKILIFEFNSKRKIILIAQLFFIASEMNLIVLKGFLTTKDLQPN